MIVSFRLNTDVHTVSEVSELSVATRLRCDATLKFCKLTADSAESELSKSVNIFDDEM